MKIEVERGIKINLGSDLDMRRQSINPRIEKPGFFKKPGFFNCPLLSQVNPPDRIEKHVLSKFQQGERERPREGRHRPSLPVLQLLAR